MAILTKTQILEASDIDVREVPVPEWGGSVLVKSLSAGQVERIQLRMKGKGLRGVTAAMLAMAIVDEQGNRLFKETDIDALSKKSIQACQRVLKAVQEQNGLDNQAIKEMAKNSRNSQGDDLLLD